MQEFRSNGKILLTGEYAVLDGAKSLALPTKLGQSMRVKETQKGTSTILWESLDKNGNIWFSAEFLLNNNSFNAVLNTNDDNDPEKNAIASRLEQLLNSAYEQNPDKLRGQSYSISMGLEFDRHWGLGSSSTLVVNLAKWLRTDPYQLLKDSFGGSGYDIAAAKSDSPITYQLASSGPVVYSANFDPEFSDQLFFVHLNRKQNSREAIAHYQNQPPQNREDLLNKISKLTEQVILCDNVEEFKLLLEAHEILISKTINLPRIKNQLFPDFPGLIKSLGGWGGDFILATGQQSEREYFRKKGFETIFEYNDLIL